MKRCLPTLLTLVTLACGCHRGGTTAGAAAAAKPASPLMRPFQGRWNFDLERTIAQWRADGVAEFEVSQLRTLSRFSRTIHHDMTIAGDAAVLHGTAKGEYVFFALHSHSQWTCGKAWLHEDRHDRGDMTKCYARLELKEDGTELHLTTRMDENPANPSDPDVTNMPAAAGSAATCASDAAPHPPWTPWRTFVFVRG